MSTKPTRLMQDIEKFKRRDTLEYREPHIYLTLRYGNNGYFLKFDLVVAENAMLVGRELKKAGNKVSSTRNRVTHPHPIIEFVPAVPSELPPNQLSYEGGYIINFTNRTNWYFAFDLYTHAHEFVELLKRNGIKKLIVHDIIEAEKFEELKSWAQDDEIEIITIPPKERKKKYRKGF